MRVAWICTGYVVFQLAVVALNETRSGAVFLSLAGCNLFLFYVGVVRRVGRVRWTVLTYFSIVHRTLLALCGVLVLLVGFLAVEAAADKVNAIWMMGLGLIALHQTYRGVCMARRRWRSSEDVMSSLRETGSKRSLGLSASYDFGFFTLVSVGAAALSRFYGQQVSVLLASVLIALAAPFLLGLIAQSSYSLRVFFPIDRDLE